MNNLKLLNIIESAILCENRIDDAKKLAISLGHDPELIDGVSAVSQKINPNHKYLNFLVKNWGNLGENIDDTIDILTYFDKNNQKFKVKDINQYNSFNELEAAVLEVSQQKRRDFEVIPDTTVLYNDDNYIVLIPESHKSSCYYGSGSKWCTTNESPTHYKNYKAAGELYYILSKTKPSSDDSYKIAVNFKLDNGSFPPKPEIEGVWDATDVNRGESFLMDNVSANVITVIKNHFQNKFNTWWKKYQKELTKKHKEDLIKNAEEKAKRDEENRIRDERESARTRERQIEKEERRENQEYDDNEYAHALFAYLVSESELTEDSDIYDLVEEQYNHYSLKLFTDEVNNKEWAIGTDSEAEESAFDSIDSLIDDVGYGGAVSDWYFENAIDGDKVAEWIEDDIDAWVREEPSSYINEDPEISEEDQKKVDDLEAQIEELETKKTKTRSKKLVAEIEEQIETLQEQIDELSNADEYSEDQIQEAIDSQVEEYRNDPIGRLSDMGYDKINKEFWEQFIDHDKFINGIISDDGRGPTLSSYDSEEREIEYNGTTYYIYRIN